MQHVMLCWFGTAMLVCPGHCKNVFETKVLHCIGKVFIFCFKASLSKSFISLLFPMLTHFCQTKQSPGLSISAMGCGCDGTNGTAFLILTVDDQRVNQNLKGIASSMM